MPGMITNFDPRAASASTNRVYRFASKKNWVVAKVAPNSSLRISTSTSFSNSPLDAGCPSGNAATPIVNPPNSSAN